VSSFPVLNHADLTAAIEHLYRALATLESARSEIAGGIMSAPDLSAKLADSWLEVNRCRLYTEPFALFEEWLVPSLGLINDAKCMIESCVAWKLGVTRSAYLQILNCINLAIIDGIRPCLEELESWMNEDHLSPLE
jgi:hypothetical protein